MLVRISEFRFIVFSFPQMANVLFGAMAAVNVGNMFVKYTLTKKLIITKKCNIFFLRINTNNPK